MLNELTNNENFLNGLFTEKDFDFLNGYDDEVQKIEVQLNLQKAKRDGIVNFINLSSQKLTSVSTKDLPSFEETLNKAKEIFELLNENIQILFSLESDLKDLNKKIVDLILKLESSNSDEFSVVTNTLVGDIKSGIANYSNKYSNIEHNLFLNNIKIDNFIKNLKFVDLDINLSLDNISLHNNKTSNTSNTQKNIVRNEKLDLVTENSSEIPTNNTLLISEKQNRVFLPYTKSEIKKYFDTYETEYKSYDDVVKQEFIVPLSYYTKHVSLSRFREAYSLIRDREGKSIFDALKFSLDIMFRRDLNPCIVAACKAEDDLVSYIDCLDKKDLSKFTAFEIKFEMNPLKV